MPRASKTLWRAFALLAFAAAYVLICYLIFWTGATPRLPGGGF